MRVPSDLRHIICATEIKKSLKCTTYHAAKSLANVWTYKTEEIFLLLRSQVFTPEQQIEVAARLADVGIIKTGWVNRAGKAVMVASTEEKPKASKEQVRKLSSVIDEYKRDKKCRWSSRTLEYYELNFRRCCFGSNCLTI
jgi:hypothetical protein